MSILFRSAAVAVVAAATAWQAGCVDARNARATVGADLSLPAISEPVISESASSTAMNAPASTRASWPRTEFVVPIDGTIHRPIWRTRFGFTDATPRQRGLYPTADSALDLAPGSGADQGTEAVVAPFLALGDAVLMPVRMVVDPGWNRRLSPLATYRRTDAEGWHISPAPSTETPEEETPEEEPADG